MATLTLSVPLYYRLSDTARWVNRFQVQSQSSGSVYIISQHREKRY